MSELSRFTVLDLKGVLRFLGGTTSGNKNELVVRIEEIVRESGRNLTQVLTECDLINSGELLEGGGSGGPVKRSSAHVYAESVSNADVMIHNVDHGKDADIDHPPLSFRSRNGSLASFCGRSSASRSSTTSSTFKRREAAVKAAKLKAVKGAKRELLLIRAETERREAETKRLAAAEAIQRELLTIQIEEQEAVAELAEWNRIEDEDTGRPVREPVVEVHEDVTSEPFDRHVTGISRGRSGCKANPQPRRQDVVKENPCPRSSAVVDEQITSKPFFPIVGTGKEDNLEAIMQDILRHNERLRLPKRDLLTFDGQVEKFALFKTAFQDAIGNAAMNEREKLHYLHQFTSGVPRELVETCLYMPEAEGHQEAWKLLGRRYGNVEVVGAEHVNRLLEVDSIGRDDAKGLDTFAIRLAMASNAVSSLPYGRSELENPKTIRLLVEKLPYTLQDRWRRIATNVARKEERSAGFRDFREFVEDEALVANNPLYGKNIPTRREPARINEKPRRVVVGTIKESDKCIYCDGSHTLIVCMQFIKMERLDKMKFLSEKRLCFMCFAEGHRARNCEKAVRCEKCNGWHQTILHIERPLHAEKQLRRADFTTKLDSGNRLRPDAPVFNVGAGTSHGGGYHGGKQGVSKPRVMLHTKVGAMAVVPIEVFSHDGQRVSTSAVIDSGSAITICSKSLADKLRVKRNRQDGNLTVVTLHGECKINGGMIDGLVIEGKPGERVPIPPVYVVDEIPVGQDDVVSKEDLMRWDHLVDIDLQEANGVEMILGINSPGALEPMEIISAPKVGDPYAVRTRIGWIVCGVSGNGTSRIGVGRIAIKDSELNDMVRKAFDSGFDDLGACDLGISAEDEKWLQIVREGCVKIDGHYEIPLPFKSEKSRIPETRYYAMKRAESQRSRLHKNLDLKARYDSTIQDMLDKGYAERVTTVTETCLEWFIPHFHVTHKEKPEKVRVVFDCAARVKKKCLNDLLIAGPRIGSELLDVLMRFREGRFAYSADIEAMFHQVMVPPSQRDYLKFFWWGDGARNMTEYRMAVHLFGSCSSPGIAAFALQQAARECIDATDSVRNVIFRNFYVDDLLRAGDSREDMVLEAKEIKRLCQQAGFNLCKFKCCQSFPEILDSQEATEMSIKTLGVCWDRVRDTLAVDITSRTQPTTRRELLSFVASIYDPLGLLAPVVMKGRLLIQQMLRDGSTKWDDCFDEKMACDVERWMELMFSYCDIVIPRNILPAGSQDTVYQIHFFSDASCGGHGAVAYLRAHGRNGITCSFLWGKSKVNPLKQVSIPRLELVAAVLATKMKARIEGALSVNVSKMIFWTDSMTVLGYIRNFHERYNVFEANRLSIIRERTQTSQWRYVNSKLNPADEASRACQTSRWLTGPDFLCQSESTWPKEHEIQTVAKEVKPVLTVSGCRDYVAEIVNFYSDWNRLKRGVAHWLKLKSMLLKKSAPNNPISVQDLDTAEIEILKFVQRGSFAEEFRTLECDGSIKKSSPLYKLDVRLVDGLIRVGGRLERAGLTSNEAHPVVLPSRAHVSDLLIRESHNRLGHMGCPTVLGSLRRKYWILRGMAAVKRIVRACILCRKVKGKRMHQKMGDLPAERVEEPEVPFQNTGLDCFGPFTVKRGRRVEKRYGVIFTCLAMRAIHIEIAVDLSTDSLMNAIRRFLARRGHVRSFLSDNGTNMVGARREMMQALSSNEVQRKAQDRNIDWQFNPPNASHFGGVWERMIGTVRRVLEATMGKQCMTDEGLSTLMCEVELCVNSRPLSIVTSDTEHWEILTPNRLLNLGVCSPVLSEFNPSDLYSRRRWRQIQYMADLFWRRWRLEYRSALQERRKWFHSQRNLAVGDVVLVIDDCEARCHWPLGRVHSVTTGRDGLVRSAYVTLRGKLMRRPIVKLILVLETEDLL